MRQALEQLSPEAVLEAGDVAGHAGANAPLVCHTPSMSMTSPPLPRHGARTDAKAFAGVPAQYPSSRPMKRPGASANVPATNAPIIVPTMNPACSRTRPVRIAKTATHMLNNVQTVRP